MHRCHRPRGCVNRCDQRRKSPDGGGFFATAVPVRQCWVAAQPVRKITLIDKPAQPTKAQVLARWRRFRVIERIGGVPGFVNALVIALIGRDRFRFGRLPSGLIIRTSQAPAPAAAVAVPDAASRVHAQGFIVAVMVRAALWTQYPGLGPGSRWQLNADIGKTGGRGLHQRRPHVRLRRRVNLAVLT